MVYDREYGEKTLSFEPSGALMSANLVMRDVETDSWWSIITPDALGGELQGAPLREIPVGEKVQWGAWKKRHPDTEILSVEGVQHDYHDAYEEYFENDRGFRGLEAEDKRLRDKEPIYAFRLNGVAYAVPHSRIEGGAVFFLEDREIFLYRELGAPLFASTKASVARTNATDETRGAGSQRFRQVGGVWRDTVTGILFSASKGFVDSGEHEEPLPERLIGVDTFWYNWEAIPEEIVVLE